LVRISYIIQYSIESKILNRYWIISFNIFLCICLAQKNILKIKEVRIFPKKLQLWGIQPTKLQNSIANKYLLLDESNNEFLEISKNGDLTRPSGLGNNQINYGDIIWMGISNNGMTLVNRLENKIIYLDYRLSHLHTISLKRGIYPDLVSLDYLGNLYLFSEVYNSVYKYSGTQLNDIPFIDFTKERIIYDCFIDMQSNIEGDLALLGCDSLFYLFSINGKLKQIISINIKNAEFIVSLGDDWIIFNRFGIGISVNYGDNYYIPKTSTPILDVVSINKSIAVLASNHIVILNVQ